MDGKITIADLIDAKLNGKKIAAVSCYDYFTASMVEQAGTEIILVGDSAAQMVLGFDSTLPATMDFMVTITAGVRRGAPNVYLIADMPFLSYQLGTYKAIKNAGRFITESNAQMVKIEATAAYLDVIKAVSDAGIAVMAHIGLRPQNIGKIGKFKAGATTAEMASDLITLADQMIQAGACSLLLEATAAETAKIITERSEVPVISCGAGPDCDGQILIAPDILGLSQGPKPKFSKSFADLAQAKVNAFSQFNQEVRSGKFPNKDHSYHMKPGQLERLNEMIAK